MRKGANFSVFHQDLMTVPEADILEPLNPSTMIPGENIALQAK